MVKRGRYLVGAADEVEVVFFKEFGHHITAERERHATVVLAPPFDVFVRITPQQIANDACTHARQVNPPRERCACGKCVKRSEAK